jgi:predicted TIM-barrel fold metal-dependent hydrolase
VSSSCAPLAAISLRLWALALGAALVLPGSSTADGSTLQLQGRARPSGIDCHMHVHPDGEAFPYDAARVRSALEGAGLAGACILSQGYQRPSGCEPPDCPSQQDWTRARNDWTLAQAKQDPALLPFCGVPIQTPWSVEEVRRCAAAGARGLKLHPVSEKLSIRDAAVFQALGAITEVAGAGRLPVLIHVGFQDRAEVDALFRLAASQPRTLFIAAHELGQNFEALLKAPPNVHAEISGLVLAPKAAWPAFLAMWRAFGVQRVLLGSDWPLLHPSEYVAALRSLPLTDEERAMIMTDNARRLFSR